ncbi:hypothetical protein HMPREF9422_1835 [Streptococcus cristatus ATCC 51100]|nr:hypothetical protein HMPREF9422_1835 [Streptococcus cristatus ATCC 51100]
MKGPKQSDLFLFYLRRNPTVQKDKGNIGFSTLKESGTEIGNWLEFDFVVPPPHS